MTWTCVQPLTTGTPASVHEAERFAQAQKRADFLSVSIRGRWTDRQSQAVMDALEDEAAGMGIRLYRLDVTHMGDTVSWFRINAQIADDKVFGDWRAAA